MNEINFNVIGPPRESYIVHYQIFIIFIVKRVESFENSKSQAYDASRVGTAGREYVNDYDEISKVRFRNDVFDAGPDGSILQSIITNFNLYINIYLIFKLEAAYDRIDCINCINAHAHAFQ